MGLSFQVNKPDLEKKSSKPIEDEDQEMEHIPVSQPSHDEVPIQSKMSKMNIEEERKISV